MKHRKRPPKIFEHFLKKVTPLSERESLAGDFLEEYNFIIESSGKAAALLWYFRQLARLSINGMSETFLSGVFLSKNYIKIAARNVKRNKLYSVINISGLSVGLAFFILVALWCRDELSYDSHHEKADRIYRVVSVIGEEGSIFSASALTQVLKDTYPEVLNTVRIFDSWNSAKVKYGDKEFIEPELYYAEPSIFDIFTIPVTAGDAETALVEPYSIVLTQGTAEKYFGKENPIGNEILVNNKKYKITGIIE